MKTSLIMLAMGLTAFATANAATPNPMEDVPAPSKTYNYVKPELPPLATPELGMRASRSDEPVIIKEVEGESIDYKYNVHGYFVYYFFLTISDSSGLTPIVFGEDNTVYIKNIVPRFPTNSYVKGEITEDGKIRVDLPQTVAVGYQGDTPLYYEIDRLHYTYTKVATDDGYTINLETEVAEDNYLIYNYDKETGEIVLETEYESNAEPNPYDMPDYTVGVQVQQIGQTEDGEEYIYWAWTGYADETQTFTIFDEKAVTIPEGLEVEEWALTSESGYAMVNVAIDKDNNQFYIGNLCWSTDGAAVGDIFDGKVTFKTPQFLGFSTIDQQFVYLCAAVRNDYDETMLDEFVFDADLDNKTLKAHEPNVYFIVNAGTEKINYLTTYLNPTLKMQTDADLDADPVDPEFWYYFPYSSYLNYGGIVWFLYGLNVNNAILDTEKMYYVIYCDGEPYTFAADEYELDEDMDEIPYSFTSSNYYIQGSGDRHTMLFFFDGAESWGVQLFYKGSNGIDYASNRIYYITADGSIENDGGATSGMATIANDEVVGIMYTNLQGQVVTNPTSGLYIKTLILKDGRRISTKVLKRN